MLIKLTPPTAKMRKIPRKYSNGTYRWVETIDLQKLVKVFTALEHVFALIEKDLVGTTRELNFMSLVKLRQLINESKKGRELLVQEEGIHDS